MSHYTQLNLKRIGQSALSMLIALVFSLGMLMQYHHHDNHGDIFFALTLNEDLALGQCHGFDSCHHDADEADDEPEECSMHIGDTECGRLIPVLPDDFMATIIQIFVDCGQVEPVCALIPVSDNAIPPTPLVASHLLRAPPFC